MVIYSLVQKPAFRRKVAEMGIDPDERELPLAIHASLVRTAGLVLFVAVPIGYFVWLANSSYKSPTYSW
jgi:hypothetical protein